MEFYEITKYLRSEIGLSQKQIASLLNISQQSYSDYENGKTEPDFKTLLKIAEILNVSTDYLLGRTDDFWPVPGSPAVSQLSIDKEILSLFHALTPNFQAIALITLRSWAGVPAKGVSKKKA